MITDNVRYSRNALTAVETSPGVLQTLAAFASNSVFRALCAELCSPLYGVYADLWERQAGLAHGYTAAARHMWWQSGILS